MILIDIWDDINYIERKKNLMNKPEIALQNTINDTEKQSSRSVCCGIYGLRNKITNKWYVGQTTQPFRDRWLVYRRLGCVHQPKILNALKKHGYDNFEKVILELCPRHSTTLNEREEFWIAHYDSVDNGYNTISIPTKPPMLGRSHTEETKTKMSLMKIGKPHSEQHRKGISDGWKLRRLRDDHGIPESARIKLSVAHKGKRLSDEHKQKLRKPKSAEHKQKIAQANRTRAALLRGTKQSPEFIKTRMDAIKRNRELKRVLSL